MNIASIVAGLALVASMAIGQSRWVVGGVPGPNVAFVGIQNAINAVASGDALVILPGAPTSFTISGKGRTLISSDPINRPTSGATTITNIPATTPVWIDGLQLVQTIAAFGPGLLTLANTALCVSPSFNINGMRLEIHGSGGGVGAIQNSPHANIPHSVFSGGSMQVTSSGLTVEEVPMNGLSAMFTNSYPWPGATTIPGTPASTRSITTERIIGDGGSIIEGGSGLDDWYYGGISRPASPGVLAINSSRSELRPMSAFQSAKLEPAEWFSGIPRNEDRLAAMTWGSDTMFFHQARAAEPRTQERQRADPLSKGT